MKLSGLLGCLAAVAAFCACSEKEAPGGANGSEDSGRFLAVEMANPVTKKALADDYETGSDAEDKVYSLRLYFFDSAGQAAAVSPGATVNYVDCPEVGDPKGADAAEKKLQAVVMVSTGTASISSLVAVANYEIAGLGTEALSLAELCRKIGAYDSPQRENGADPHFLMTSSSYAGAEGLVVVTEIKPSHLCETEELAKENPIVVHIERVVAKTRLRTAWTGGIVTKGGVIYNGQTYVAVALKDHSGQEIKSGGNQVYALFTAWDVTGTVDNSYLFKKVNTPAAWNLGWIWNNSDFFRSYWAMNPDRVTLGYVRYSDIAQEVGPKGAAYCLENAADNFSDGTKSSYDPAAQTSNRTQAIIAAVLVTVDGNNQATPVDLARWAGMDYTEAGAKTAMLNTVSTDIYVKEGSGFVSIKPEHVRFVTATAAGMADDSSEESPRYLSCLQLTDAARSLQFYASASDAATLTGSQVDGMLKEIPGAKVWKSGLTYYYTDIRHLGAAETKGLYGVVRNHIYDVNINSVVGLGTPVYDPDEVIVPQKPDKDETYIAAEVKILAWRVVDNDTDLEW
ncbi:Mfa1 family fimbria major subunit [uncultured Alistipes sp.]|uniref:Mfa1 family fimbria major subunit n=1 Tax=uncultured Alistipes sp. TaxID=538949 RepID=UPI00266FA050|nr:Mfa1 family fimbria major subunit [uncultured Alistipes sp.]